MLSHFFIASRRTKRINFAAYLPKSCVALASIAVASHRIFNEGLNKISKKLGVN
jgi:hypothetical protein